jgi:hypothetical protein
MAITSGVKRGVRRDDRDGADAIEEMGMLWASFAGFDKGPSGMRRSLIEEATQRDASGKI